MADQNPTRPVSSFLPSPKFFNTLFSPKTPQDPESSPTSILDPRVNNPFETTKTRPDKSDPEGIALALIKELPGEVIIKPNTINRKVLLASNLKIQIPEFSGDYGIKTRSPHFSGSGSGSPFTGPLSLKEMELSEEYTRVVSHGPNPKTTHIYDNCVVERCCGVIGSPELKKPGPKRICESFLSFCHTCNKNLEGIDILIYRGDKGFCSEECRSQEMILDGLMMN
ncbi:hypothetical protein L1987_86021 [Smallanthus sonchifolius]|uniref:Uncharacterized protein n=1 Tax=Smallanthus sonchifolius TaxID=185202 RepID=A0ACB8XZR6_9ASTR|nr:hypothetical protein L1987_86021 [Smallanthus sonchifolius]